MAQIMTHALPEAELNDLKAKLLADRLASYYRLRGGFPIPLAGAIYWAILAYLGQTMAFADWVMVALWGSGAIFPLALILAKLFKNKFMKDKNAVLSVLPPTFISMLLFWPMLVVATKTDPSLFPVILAIGMSIHWPVIGWSYGRSALFSAHAIIRAVVVAYIFFTFPDKAQTLLPLSVAIIYLLTVGTILFDTRRSQTSLQS